MDACASPDHQLSPSHQCVSKGLLLWLSHLFSSCGDVSLAFSCSLIGNILSVCMYVCNSKMNYQQILSEGSLAGRCHHWGRSQCGRGCLRSPVLGKEDSQGGNIE